MLRAPPHGLTGVRPPRRGRPSGRSRRPGATTAGSRRIRRWPSAVGGDETGVRQGVDQPLGIGVRRLPVAAVVHDEGRDRRRCARPGRSRRTRPTGMPTKSSTVRSNARRVRSPKPRAAWNWSNRDSRLHHRRQQHQALRAEPAEAQGQVGRDGAERVRDDGLGRAEPGEDGVERLAELDAMGAARPGRRRGRSRRGTGRRRGPPGGRRDQRLDERRELAAAPAPAVHQVDDRAVAEDVPPHLALPGRSTVNGSPPGGSGVGGHPGRRGEPEVAGDPAGRARARAGRRSGRRRRTPRFRTRTIVLF